MEGSITVTFQDGTQKELKASMVEAGGGGGEMQGVSLSEMWEQFKQDHPTDWRYAFVSQSLASNDNIISRYLTDERLAKLDFTGSKNVTNISYMFAYCRALTSIPQLDFDNLNRFDHAFESCSSLIEAPFFDASHVDANECGFQDCTNLKTIPAYDFSNINSFYYSFRRCNNLEQFHATGMKANFDISFSTKFTREALIEILNNLATVSETKTLTIGATNLNKLTDEDKAIATSKGWTLA